MAIREIRKQGDPVLEKVCKPVKEMTPRLSDLVDDMLETMYDANGVGLAAPQVGVLRRIVVIDVGEGPYVLINPEITERDGEQTGQEGCLSVPGVYGIVTRPEHVKAKALDKDMKPYEIDAEGLFARAVCHELDHLDGKMYTSLVEDGLHSYDEQDDDEEIGRAHV